MLFDCRIDGPLLCCTITSDRDLVTPVFCCSGMAPIAPVSGGTPVMALGGYCETQLPDLTAGVPHRLTLRYVGGHVPANRAWMPLGAYLRCDGESIALPALPSGASAPDYTDLAPFDGLRVVPQPDHWQADGRLARIAGLSCTAAELASIDALFQRLNLGPVQRPDAHPVTLESAGLAPESYRLTITPDGTSLAAGDDAGRLYGLLTLATLMRNHAGAVPCGTLTDGPRFGWRGQHLDCARHFFAPATIRHLLDLMALLKLNRFHWHFADDEAFRIRIDSFPDLWQKLAFRGEGEVLPGLFGGGIRAGGSYTKAEVAEIVAHAASLNIAILPEIEVPAHALGLARVFPETRDPDDTGTEATVQGYTQSAVNPAMPATWEILTRLTAEIGAMFPLGILHLGCDELAAETWMGSPAARALMVEQGLVTTKDLQGWTMSRLSDHVQSLGLRPAAWEEAAQGVQGIGHDAILFSWTGQGPGIAAARAGYDVVMTPAQHVYLDMAHTSDPQDWGANWAACIGLAQTIDWDPVPPEATAFADRIIGVQGCFWGEFTTQDHELMPMIMPRILGVAAKAWQRDGTPDLADLERLAGTYQRLLG